MRRYSRFLRKRRQIRRLPLWVILALIAWAATMTFLDRDTSSTSDTLLPVRANASAPATVPVGQFPASVMRVADGDTLTAQTDDGRQLKVRLARIDAPETGHGDKRPGQPFGEASTRSLRQLVSGGSITLDCPEIDRYQRHVCWVFADGLDVNLEQVRRGMAWVYQPPRASRRERLALTPLMDAEDAARNAARGLWKGAEPTAPWDWRKDCWQAGKCG